MNKEFGYYSPDKSTSLLQLVKKLGLSRGLIRKKVIKKWREKGYKIVDIIIDDISYRLDIINNTTDEKILTSSKVYDKTEIDALAKTINLKSGIKDSVFVDIGANTGYYSLNLAKRGFTKVISIEPNPPTLNLLSYNVKINNLDQIIKIIPLCIGDGSETSFYCSKGLGAASVFKDKDSDIEPIIVKSDLLFNILKNENIQRIDALKIDIEGFEDRALCPFFSEAPKALWPKTVVMEYNENKDLWEEDIIKKMKEIGYLITKETRGNLILNLNLEN